MPTAPSSETTIEYWIRVVPPAVLSSGWSLDHFRSYSQMARKLLNGAADEVENKYKEIVVTDFNLPKYSLKAMSKENDFEKLFSVEVQGDKFKGKPKTPKNLEGVVAGIELISRVILRRDID